MKKFKGDSHSILCIKTGEFLVLNKTINFEVDKTYVICNKSYIAFYIGKESGLIFVIPYADYYNITIVS